MTLKQTVWLHKTLPTAGWPCYTCACIALQDSPERAARPPSRPPPWLSVGGQEAPGAVRGMAHILRAVTRGPCSSQSPKWTFTLAQLGASRGGGRDSEEC